MKESDAKPIIDNQAVFDALPARIVVVATDGVILASNRAWQQYLDKNWRLEDKVNDNYYKFWSVKGRKNNELANEVLAGVKAVQTGSQTEFTLKYACAIPSGECWCKLQARPLGDGQGSVVVAHEELTEKPPAGGSHYENEARLRTLLNATPDGVVFKDGSGRWLMANQAAMDHLGLDLHDYQYKTNHELALQFPGLRTFHESSIKSDQQAWEAGKTFRVLESIPLGEGGVRFVDITKVPLFNPDGSRLGLVIMGRDVSDRLESESALRAAKAELEEANARLERRVAERTRELVQSEERFRTMFDRHVAVMLLIEPETGAIRAANAAAARFYGYTREQLCSMLVCAINPLPPEELAALRAGVVAGRQNFFILPQRAAHGRMYECEIYSTPIQTGGETLLFSIIHDVSARRLAEAQLLKLSQAVEQCSSPVVITDVHGRIEFINPAFTQFTGYSAAEAIGRTHRLLQAGTHPREFYDAIWTVLRSGQVWRGEICDRKKNGELYWKLISIAPVRNAKGEVINYVSTELDITEQREIHERLRQAKEAADEASQAKTTFLASMSHEIRTPMNSILGYAQLLQRDPALPAAAQEKISVINRSGEHLLTMINDVLEMSKIEAGRVVIQPVSFNLHDLLNDLAAMLQLRAGDKGLEFKVVDATDLPGNLLADIGKIRQVLINLIGNAVKFTERGQIEMRAASRPEEDESKNTRLWLTIEIEDTGPGISPVEITQLFQQFVQTSSGRKHHSGTGLGLTISREYARLMGGDITVTSQEGRGSCFKFEIPIRLAPVETSGALRRNPRVTGLQPDQPPVRVLLAEDQRDNADWLNQLLTLVGCEVRQVADGAAAVRLCETWTPQLILMDLQMPVMDGYEATRRIKASPAGGSIVIIAVTATVFEETRQAILAAGAQDMLAKPVDEHQLFNQIRQHLGVKFRTEEETTPPAAGSFDPDTVAKLPAILRAELQAATFNGDSEQLAGLLDEVARHDAHLAEFLRALADRYDYIALARHLGRDD